MPTPVDDSPASPPAFQAPPDADAGASAALTASDVHEAPFVLRHDAIAAFEAFFAGAQRRALLFTTGELVMAALAGVVIAFTAIAVAQPHIAWTMPLWFMAWGILAVGVVAGAAHVAFWRLWPLLRHDAVVARFVEDALRRKSAKSTDIVRTAAALISEPDTGNSNHLAQAHVQQTLEVLQRERPLASFFGVALERGLNSVLALTLALVALGGLAVVVPRQVKDTALLLWSSEQAHKAAERTAKSAIPLVTQLSVALHYPSYMNLPDEVQEGSSGDITAPKGTEVNISGRADRSLSAASLLVGEETITAEVDGTLVRAHFVVKGDTSYRFALESPRRLRDVDPVAHKITVVADAAPVVTLATPIADATLKLDEPIMFRFRASDDFGLVRFVLSAKRQGSDHPPFEKELSTVDNDKEASGEAELTLEDMGARPGDKLAVTIDAYDNDAVSGQKAGRSVTRVLTVFSAIEQHQLLLARLGDVLDKMTDSLADELEADLQPLIDTLAKPGAGAEKTTAQKAAQDRHKIIESHHESTQKALSDAFVALADDELATPGLRQALANMRGSETQAMDKKRAALKIAFATDRASTLALSRARAAQTELIARLEQDAIYLDDLLKTERIAQAEQLAKDLARAQEDVRDLIQQYKKSGDENVRKAILEEIKRMRAQMQALMAELSQLERDVPDEYLNEEAMHAQDMQNQADDIDKMLEEGRLDDAEKALSEMLDNTKKLVDNLEKTADDMGGGEYKELREKLDRFSNELRAVQEGQNNLEADSSRLLDRLTRERQAQQGNKAKAALQELKRKADKAVDDLKRINPDVLFGPEADDLDHALARAEELKRALDAMDIEDALEAGQQAATSAQLLKSALGERSRGRFGTRDRQTTMSKEGADDAHDKLDDVVAGLKNLLPNEADMLDGAAQKKLGRDADEQDKLAENAARLKQLMGEIGQEAPMFSPDLQQKLDDARGQMARASKAMRQKNLRQAQDAQRQANKRLGELQQALDEMAQNGSGQGQGMPMPFGKPSGGRRGDEEGGNQQARGDDVKIPDGKGFKVKDQYRKDIMDAMREEAPPSFADEVKRYYEELVK